MNHCFAMRLPRAVYGGENALDRLGTAAEAWKKEGKQTLLMTDRQIREAGILDRIIKILEPAGIPFLIADTVPREPDCDQVQKIIDSLSGRPIGGIVAVGGGSVMDTAKLASVLLSAPCGVRELLENADLAKKRVPTVMIPTTAGTGSEATPNSIVAVPEKELKVGIVSDQMMADSVILAPELLKSLPMKVAASTGIDALCHAIECFTSKKANPASDLFAMEAMELIFSNLERACLEKENMEAKGNMLWAAFLAGAAIAASGTTAVHAISYPLGGGGKVSYSAWNGQRSPPAAGDALE